MFTALWQKISTLGHRRDQDLQDTAQAKGDEPSTFTEAFGFGDTEEPAQRRSASPSSRTH